MTWDEEFSELFKDILKKYRDSTFDYKKDYTADQLSFLASIGYQPREFFDFIEDFADEQTPSPTTALLIAAVRRDYFLVIQNGKKSNTVITADDLPSFGEELFGLPYLPRILTKARAKLKGELDPDMMYSCGGDRNFLSKNGNLHPADFLRHVWDAEDDDQKIVDWIKSSH